MLASGKPLSDFESNWADGEPNDAQNMDCAYMESTLKYKSTHWICNITLYF